MQRTGVTGREVGVGFQSNYLRYGSMALMLSFILVGVLFISLSWPMIQGHVPPNSTYGFRTEKTLSSPSIWYPANAFAGWVFLGASVVTMGATVAFLFVPKIRDSMTAYGLSCAGVLLGSQLLGALVDTLYLHTL